MIYVSPKSSVPRESLSALSPDDYLTWLRGEQLKELMIREGSADFVNQTGIRLTSVDGVPVYEVVDIDHAITDYVSRGLTDEQARNVVESIQRSHDWQQEINSQHRKVIKSLGVDLIARLQPKHQRLLGVPIDMMPVNYFNAGAGPVPRGGDFVVMNMGMAWLSVWCRWSLWKTSQPRSILLAMGEDAWASWSSQARVPYLLDKVENRHLLVDLCLADFIVNNNAHYSVLANLVSGRWGKDTDSERVEYARSIAHLILVFTLLHEFGHITEGHTDKLRTWMMVDPKHSSDDALSTRCRAMRSFEHEADQFAVRHMCLEEAPEDAWVHALILLFHLFEAARLAELNRGNWIAPQHQTHPLPNERVLRIFPAAFHGPSKEIAEGVARFLGSIGALLATEQKAAGG